MRSHRDRGGGDDHLRSPRLERVTLSAGALVWAGFDGPAVPGPLLDAIERGRIGGLLLFAYRGNIRSREQVRGMLREAVGATRRGGLPPVPVGVDQEGGSLRRTAYAPLLPTPLPPPPT